MLVLYEIAISPFVQKVKIALREKGIEFESRLSRAPEYRAAFERVSPRQEVPTLVDGDTAVFDSTIILDYIEERWPEPPLMPTDPAARAEVRMLEEICDTQLEAINFGLSEVTLLPARNQAAAQAVLARGRAELKDIFALLEGKLGDADYFGGASFGRADLCVLPYLNAAQAMKNGPETRVLTAWLKRVNARPSVQATVAEVKAAIPIFKEMMGRIQSGAERRHFRDHRLDWFMRSGGAPILFERIEGDSVRFPPSYA